MGLFISKIKLKNFKKFQNYCINFNERINVLVGDNESGKSSILEAIDIVTSASLSRLESAGIDKLLNIAAVQEYLDGDKSFNSLPELVIELFLEGGDNDDRLNGRNNSDNTICDGLRLVYKPNPEYTNEIMHSVEGAEGYFPYDYYEARFSTFADEAYSSFRKFIKSILVDAYRVSAGYAIDNYVKRMYSHCTEADVKERAYLKSEYRKLKDSFSDNALSGINKRIEGYSFGLNRGPINELVNNLMLFENGVGIDSAGAGKQAFIKTSFALKKSGFNADVILLEEPENHLSHSNLRKLIKGVLDNQPGQLFVSTHSSFVSARLELNNLLIMGVADKEAPVSLVDLDQDTAKYFVRAPVANIIEFSLSTKVILVEGPSEYMLFDTFYMSVKGKSLEEDGVHVIDIRGLSFERYLKVAILLGNKVAVVTDNDRDYKTKIEEKYKDYRNNSEIRIFSEKDDNKYTFEVALYDDNKVLCDRLFRGGLNYMKTGGNKTEAAYRLLMQTDKIEVPQYIREAIEWISD